MSTIRQTLLKPNVIHVISAIGNDLPSVSVRMDTCSSGGALLDHDYLATTAFSPQPHRNENNGAFITLLLINAL